MKNRNVPLCYNPTPWFRLAGASPDRCAIRIGLANLNQGVG